MTLIGANGAGKSTTLRSINGLQPAARRARSASSGEDITEAPRARDRADGHLAVAGGPPRLPADVRAREPRDGRLPAHRRAAACARTSTASSTLFPRLAERKSQKAGTLSGGEQQMLAIGRALMARPKLLLLDEPSMGLAPIFVERIFEIVLEINEQGTPVLLVEQNALMALDAADRGYVLETGRIALAGHASDAADERAGAQDLPRRALVHFPADEERGVGRRDEEADPGSAGARRRPSSARRPCRASARSRASGRPARRGSPRRRPRRAGRAPVGTRPSRGRAGVDGRPGPAR